MATNVVENLLADLNLDPNNGGGESVQELVLDGRSYKYFDLPRIGGEKYKRLPYCLRVLFECCVRKAGLEEDKAIAAVWEQSARSILSKFKNDDNGNSEVLFQPGRVVLQDFTGVAALVDLAAIRDHVAALGLDPSLVDSKCPADLVVDHSVQVDFSQVSSLLAKQRKEEEEQFLELQQEQQLVQPQEQVQQQVIGDHRGAASAVVFHNIFPPVCPCANNGNFQSYPALPPQPQQLHQVQVQHHHHPEAVAGVVPSQEVYFQPPPPTTVTSVMMQPVQFGYMQPPPHPAPTPVAHHNQVHPYPPPPLPVVAPEPQPTTNKKPEQQQHLSTQPFGGARAKVPEDNPGLPIQDEVCPFHQRLTYWADNLQKSRHHEMAKNEERFAFLKWVDKAFGNITVIPPGTGVLHQVNLEYLARVVATKDGYLFPDLVVGTDIHSPMINGLGVLGWTVGTLEAESVMFGHPLTLNNPKVVGVKLLGRVPKFATSMDVVLHVTKELRKQSHIQNGASDEDVFVEFFGPAVEQLSITDRSAIANLCSEYGSMTGFFPVDAATIEYLEHTGRERHSLASIKSYLEKVLMLRPSYSPEDDDMFDAIVEVYLPDIVVTISGPKRTKDKVELGDVAKDFHSTLDAPGVGPRAFGLDPEKLYGSDVNVDVDGDLYTLKHGTILLSSLASCSNSSNPSVMLTAGILAKKAVEAGLSIPKHVKRSLSPGSGMVTSYLQDSGVMPYLHMLGFEVMGYGCTACVENSRVGNDHLLPENSSLICCGVLSGNRNFDGRVRPEIKANYLASPPLVIAYALAGRINIDFENEPLGYDASDNKPVYLKDIWPTRGEIQELEKRQVIPAVFKLVSTRINYGNKEWSCLDIPSSLENPALFQWDVASTLIRSPSYLQGLTTKTEYENVTMRCLLKLGDNITSDQISPAGSIVRGSPAADLLAERGLAPRQFLSYGVRRGNSDIMMRGTFANNKLKNLIKGHTKVGPFTIHVPSGVPTTIFEASEQYRKESTQLVIVAGENFGRGSPRDWSTKGPFALGIRVVLALSFSSAYRASLVRTGIMPVRITKETYGSLSGLEAYEFKLPQDFKFDDRDEIEIRLDDGREVHRGVVCLTNAYEAKLLKDGGILKQSLNNVSTTMKTLTLK